VIGGGCPRGLKTFGWKLDFKHGFGGCLGVWKLDFKFGFLVRSRGLKTIDWKSDFKLGDYWISGKICVLVVKKLFQLSILK